MSERFERFKSVSNDEMGSRMYLEVFIFRMILIFVMGGVFFVIVYFPK